MTNSADPDQLASSGSTLFVKAGHVVFSKRRVKTILYSKPSYNKLSNKAVTVYNKNYSITKKH